MKMFEQLTIVTSCRGYGKYLQEWSDSIIRQSMKPGAVVVFTHGSANDSAQGHATVQRISRAGIVAYHVHHESPLDFGVARNCAVELAKTDWVMHLDADDTLLPHAVEEYKSLEADADVISSGYYRTGQVQVTASRRARLYESADGLRALQLSSICSGISPFRKTLWEKSPYRTDMVGAWDTALWIGFARLGARFRATRRPVFNYRQHPDSIFNQRRKLNNWTRSRTTAHLKSLRRNDSGVAIIVPRDTDPVSDRARVWRRVKEHYTVHHPEWPIVEGQCIHVDWSKGEAVTSALQHTTADVLVIADADCIVDPVALQVAVDCVLSRKAMWAVPHRMVHRANSAWTDGFLATSAANKVMLPDKRSYDREPYEGFEGGGILVTRRVWYEAMGGIPRAFRGWGQEDQALGLLCRTFLGPGLRGEADLLHLYHTPQATRRKPAKNLAFLRRLGHAAMQSPDALVRELATLPNSPNPMRATWKARAPQPRPGIHRPQARRAP